MKALAVDLGGTHAQCAVVEDNKILLAKHLDLDSAQGLSTVLPRLAETFRELLAATHLTEKDCAGLSFGSCGLVDSSTSRFLSMNQKWSDAPQLDLVGCRDANFFFPCGSKTMLAWPCWANGTQGPAGGFKTW